MSSILATAGSSGSAYDQAQAWTAARSSSLSDYSAQNSQLLSSLAGDTSSDTNSVSSMLDSASGTDSLSSILGGSTDSTITDMANALFGDGSTSTSDQLQNAINGQVSDSLNDEENLMAQVIQNRLATQQSGGTVSTAGVGSFVNKLA